MQDKKRLIFAHRGLFGERAPENSLTAFQLAIGAGLGIELDVRLTKDGVPVVFHDKTLIRMCSDPRRVSQIDYAELKKLRLCGFDEGIPTLSEALELIGGQVPLLVETKLPKRHRWHRRLERRILPLLDAYRGELWLQSFNKFSMKYMKRKMPDTPCGILSGSLYPEPTGFDFVSYRLSGLSHEKAAQLKKKYPLLFAWTVIPLTANETENAFSSLNLDGIIL